MTLRRATTLLPVKGLVRGNLKIRERGTGRECFGVTRKNDYRWRAQGPSIGSRLDIHVDGPDTVNRETHINRSRFHRSCSLETHGWELQVQSILVCPRHNRFMTDNSHPVLLLNSRRDNFGYRTRRLLLRNSASPCHSSSNNCT